MDWLNENWLALIGTVVAVGAFFQSSRSDRRSVTANEIAQAALEEAQKYSPPWKLQWVTGDLYELLNNGTDIEYDISVTFPQHSVVQRFENPIAKIGPKSSVTFVYATVMATRETNLTVEWSRTPEGDRHQWSGAIPRRSDK